VNRIRDVKSWVESITESSRLWLSGLFLVAMLGLAGCTSGVDLDVGNWFDGSNSSTVTTTDVAALSQGGAQIAMLLPLSASGEAADIARALKEAGELAVFEAGQAGIVLTTKDTLGTPAGAQAAVQAAIQEGAELIIGPLFSNSVRAISPVTQAGGIPVVAFSTDQNVAAQGVYLLSFLPEQEVARVVQHALSSGGRNFAALVPQSPYGTVVERAMTEAVRAGGGQMVAIERFARTDEGIQAPVRNIAQKITSGTSIDAVLIAEGGTLLRSIGSLLAQNGVSPSAVQFLGTGLWDEADVNTIPTLIGGWYAGPPPSTKQQFATRFQSAYGREPPRLASLAYDAVSLSIAFSRQPVGERFSAPQFTNPEGFAGVDGLFRLLPSGLNERGLAVMQVTTTGASEVSPAPARFPDSGS
jgi:outer membrane PBP1 activator LpoA protein